MQRTIQQRLNYLAVRGPGFWTLVSISGAIAALAIFLWISQQLVKGLGVTGMNTPTYWGLYITSFVFFVGLSAGGIVIAGIVHAFGIERFRPVARIAELVAISSIILATVAILVDMGKPERLLNLFIYAQWGSPLMWDVTIIILYTLMALSMGYLGTREDLVKCIKAFPKKRGLYNFLALGYTDISPQAIKRDKATLKVLAFLSIPGAVLLHSITAWILGLIKATPGWHTALLAPIFIGSALVSGLAMVILAAILCRKALKLEIEDKVILDMSKILIFLIPVLFYFLFAELLTIGFAGETVPLAFFKEIMSGKYAPVFWFDMVLGLIVPFLILISPRLRTVTGVGIASLFVILGVLAERSIIVIPPLLRRLMPYPPGSYTPSAVELTIMVGFFALGVLAFTILAKLTPLVELEEK